MVLLEKCLDVLDSVIIGNAEIFFRCRCADGVIGSSVLNMMFDVLHLDVHQLWI